MIKRKIMYNDKPKIMYQRKIMYNYDKTKDNVPL